MSVQNARFCKGNARVHLFGRRGYVVAKELHLHRSKLWTHRRINRRPMEPGYGL